VCRTGLSLISLLYIGKPKDGAGAGGGEIIVRLACERMGTLVGYEQRRYHNPPKPSGNFSGMETGW
jgi:hypothetical protein